MPTVPITFLTGHSGRPGLLGVLSFPDMLEPDAMFCRMFTYLDGKWFQEDLQFQCKSLTYLKPPGVAYGDWWVLGKKGEVAELADGPMRIDQIPGAGLNFEKPYGYVETIKNIGGELYVCGYGRQVYKLVGGEWLSIADDILTRERGRGFFDIDGADTAHVYAVGWNGEIYFHDGATWHQDDSPTTAHLGSVRCLGPDDVWICGDNGVVLHGSFNQWQIIEDPAFTENWYSIEEFGGKIYLAGNDVLACIEDNKIQLVDVGLGKPFTVHKLHAKDGQLWSIGRADILVFDGSVWKEIIHPDNV